MALHGVGSISKMVVTYSDEQIYGLVTIANLSYEFLKIKLEAAGYVYDPLTSMWSKSENENIIVFTTPQKVEYYGILKEFQGHRVIVYRETEFAYDDWHEHDEQTQFIWSSYPKETWRLVKEAS